MAWLHSGLYLGLFLHQSTSYRSLSNSEGRFGKGYQGYHFSIQGVRYYRTGRLYARKMPETFKFVGPIAVGPKFLNRMQVGLRLLVLDSEHFGYIGYHGYIGYLVYQGISRLTRLPRVPRLSQIPRLPQFPLSLIDTCSCRRNIFTDVRRS